MCSASMKTRQELKTLHPTAGRIDAPIRHGWSHAYDPSQFRLAFFFVVATIATDGSDDRRVSLLDGLVDSDFVKISRSLDFDHFRSIEGLGEANSIPLDCRDFAASFASLRLKACTVYLQRTFPQILQVQYSTTGAIMSLLMDDGLRWSSTVWRRARRHSCWSKAARNVRSWSSRPIWSP